MIHLYSPTEFLEKLTRDAAHGTAPSVEGMVNPQGSGSEVLLFSVHGCDSWVSVPVPVVQYVEPLGSRLCGSTSYPLVRLHFKEFPTPRPAWLPSLLRPAAFLEDANRQLQTNAASKADPEDFSLGRSLLARHSRLFEPAREAGPERSAEVLRTQTVGATIIGVGALFYFDLTVIMNIEDGSEVGMYNVGIWGPTGPGVTVVKAGGATNFTGTDLIGKRARVELLQSPGVTQVSFWLADGTPIATLIGTGLGTTFTAGGGEGMFERVRRA